MIVLIGGNLDTKTAIYTFFFHNTDTNWYHEMTCRNSVGTSDMMHRTPNMTWEEFKVIAGDRIA